MMGRAERPASDQRLARLEEPDDAVDLGRLQRFFQGERWQNGGQSLREHRFSRSGRADQQHVVASGSGDFQGALDRFLAFDFGEIDFFVVVLLEDLGDVDAGRRDLRFPFEEAHGLAQILNGNNLKTGNDRSLRRVFRRDKNANFALFARPQRYGQNSFDRADCTCWLLTSARFACCAHRIPCISEPYGATQLRPRRWVST